ncbi:MAG: sulfatase [Planctomycetota bacterium]
MGHRTITGAWLVGPRLARRARIGRAPLERAPLERALVGLALAVTALAGCGRPSDPRPNLLLVVLDTTRADHLSCYGYDQASTPAIDGLAAEGVLCEEAWSSSSLTPVSAGSFLTGAWPYRTGIRSLFMVGAQELSGNVVTLAEIMADAGYTTGGFVSATPMSRRYDLHRGFEFYSDKVRGDGPPRRGINPKNEYQRRGDTTTERALAWLGDAADGERPFAALVHYFDSHDASFVPPRAFLEPRVDFALPADLDEYRHLKGIENREFRRQLYDAEIEFMDLQVSRLLEALDDAGVRDNTLVVLIADHGEGLGQHDFWTHGLLWKEQLRVPWILAGPGLPAGRRLEPRVRLVDLVPTLLELLDLERPPTALIDGESILPLLDGPPPELPREVYAEVAHAPDDQLGRDPQQHTLVAGPWKFVERPGDEPDQLFNLDDDPTELTNLYRHDHPVAQALRAELTQRGAFGNAGDTEHLDAATIEMLKDLGYL